MMRLKPIAFFICLFAGQSLFAQYTLNGNASQNDCHCYTLTNDAFNQTGSVWNNNKINLNQSFDFSFDIFLGCADTDGADGIAFVLQPISTSVGTTGNGLGYSGVMPAVGVTIDTWQNGSPYMDGPDGDPEYDHIAIQLNGDLNHKDSLPIGSANNIAGPVTALAGSNNIEDCQWHILRIRWDAPTRTLSAYTDGILRVSAVKDLVTQVFGGDALVFWGFTGSTGGAKNLQQMCTALKPLFRLLPDQKRCIGEKIYFFDSTISFAPLQKRYWNFGDGSPVDSVNINPVHAYVAAGEYTVLQTVLGADGCTEINSRKITIGSKPLAEFTFSNGCAQDSAVRFVNTSSATFGTLDQWFWDFGNGDISTEKELSKLYATPGSNTVRLAVKSLEGCLSDTISHLIQVYDKPSADFSFTNNQCANIAVPFTGTATVSDGTIANWAWNLDGTATAPASGQTTSHLYSSPGQYNVWLIAKSNNGCASDTVSKLLTIVPSPVAGFTNGPACLGTSVLFTDSSRSVVTNPVTGWWWDFGNSSTATTQNVTATYNTAGDWLIQLVAKSGNGCISDTLTKTISIESKPVAGFGYASPLCDNNAVQFSDSSTIGNGTIKSWYWLFGNGNTANTPATSAVFTVGNHAVRLVVSNSNGCAGDTVTRVLFINPRPVVDFTFSNACVNTTVNFQGSSQSGIAAWQWRFDNGSGSTAKDTAHIFTTGGNFPVKLSGRSLAGCYSDTVQKIITIYSTQAFAGNDTIAAINQPIQLSASGGINYEWSPVSGLSNPDIYNPVAVNSSDRTYILRAFTPFGCESFDTLHVKVYEGPEIYVPTAFTPNGDGLNEVLKALPIGIKQFKNFTVYNRLGQVVFFTTDYRMGWNGFFKGKAQPVGTYTWTVVGTGYPGNEIAKKGTVLLIR